MAKALYSKKGLSEKQLEIREIAMADLRAFVGLVAPERVLGHSHHDLLKWLQDDWLYQLCIWPRGHQKSTMLGYWAAQNIIKYPESTTLYASATLDLAEKQLYFIKNILTSDIVRKYWPGLFHDDEGKRNLWRNNEISTDHWKRKQENIRDPSIKAVGVGGNVAGFHCDNLLLDDIVVIDNAMSKTGRTEVERSYSLFNSVKNAGGVLKAVGTRYHPEDLYGKMMTMVEEEDDGTETNIYSVTQEVVEVDGQFFWPRSKRLDGKAFGFDKKELRRIKANYLDKAQFFAQYYNDPSDPMNKKISNFEYYDREKLQNHGRTWSVGSQSVNVYAAIDIAATMTERSDYTCIAVVGVSSDHNIFVLDLDRFKTDKISVMADHLEKMYTKWGWIKLRAEVNAAQNLAIEQIKDFNRERGIFYTVDKHNEMRNKELRIMTNLEPRYAEGKIFHYRGGNCQILEDELQATKPPHDDVSDALAAAVEIATPPMRVFGKGNVVELKYHKRFGGIL